MTKQGKPTIFVDESGTLPDPKDKVIIIATVGTSMPKKLNQATKSTRKYLRQRDRGLSEIKFYRAGERTKRRFLKELAKQPVEIFSLIVEKEGQKKDLKMSHVDSLKDSRVNAADMIAGSLLWLKTGKDPQFYQMIKEKIIVEKTISWKNLRRKLFKEKISSNRRKRPS